MSSEQPVSTSRWWVLARFLAIVSLSTAFLLFVGCSSGKSYRAKRGPNYPFGYVERGVASWYGPGFHGNLTANGERYNMDALTAAHRTLPMGSIVEVRSLTNGRRITVRINDRGPFVGGRIIDLSRRGAKELNMTIKGTDRVEIKVVGYRRGRYGTSGFLTVQVGSFADEANARALKRQLAQRYSHVRVVSIDLGQGRRYRVLVGQFRSERRADALAVKLASQLDTETLVIRDDT